MANGTPLDGRRPDPENFVLRSGVRSGLKREFSFAIKAQAGLPASLGRTRSGKSPIPDSLGHGNGKRPKSSGGEDEIAGSSTESPIRALRPPNGNQGAGVETSTVVDCRDEAKPDAAPLENGSVTEISTVIDSHGVLSKEEIALPEKPTRRLTRLASKATVEIPNVIGDEEDTEAGVPHSSMAQVGSVVESFETPVVVGDSDGSNSAPLEDRSAVQTPIMVSDHGGSKEDRSPLETPMKRFTRSALKDACKDPLAITPPAVRLFVEQVGSLVDDARSPNMDSSAPDKLNNGNAMDIGVTEKTSRRFTRSVLKVPLIEQEGSMLEAALNDHGGCKENGSLVQQPARRFTRSAIKVAAEDSAELDLSQTPARSEETKSGESTDDGSLRMTLKKKMELKMSKKIALTKLPSNVRELLGTGMLEGFPVKYMSNVKKVGLDGVIMGNNILCSCASCKGSKAVSAYQFELHAGSTKKHPSNFIYLENGNSLRDVLRACTGAPLDMLEAAIQNATGTVPPKRPSICQNCRESFNTSRTGKFAFFCDSCLEAKEPETTLSTSSGSSSYGKISRIGSAPDSSDNASNNVSSYKKASLGKLTKKDLGLHKLVFMDDILPEGTEVAYYNHGKKLLDGYIKDSGIYCSCCETVVSPSQFEAHAGRASRRKPYNNIYTSNGVSLHELSVSLSKGRKLSTCENDDLCSICADGGNLLLCDLCPRAFHKECVGMPSVPKGDWHCQYCQNMHQREKFVEYNDNAIAAGRVAGVDPIDQIIKRSIRIVTKPGTDVGGCGLCRCHDFSTARFDPRTVLICDQCEREYHVECLKDHNMGDLQDLQELPEEEWFCCLDCSRIHAALQELLLRGSEPLQDLEADIIMKKCKEKGLNKDAAVDVRWRLLNGKTSAADSQLLLSEAVSIFHESFDPIVEAATGRNLIPFMVNGGNMRDQDFGGMYCAVLTVNSAVVSAGIVRIFGSEVAELPLVATSRESQGQGYFQSLFLCIERLLGSLNVKHFVLPAADEALSIWTKKFGFTKIGRDQLQEYTKGARLMVFQGTSMLHKPVPRCPNTEVSFA